MAETSHLGVLLERDSLDRGDLDFSHLLATLPDWHVYPRTSPAQQSERIHDATVIVTNKLPLTRAAMDAAPRLQLVCISATGTNNVDLDAAAQLGIPVCNARGYATPSVVQHVFALVLALTTRLPAMQQAIAAQRWQHSEQFCLLDFPVRELAGATLGIIGYGELGKAVAAMAQAFGMRVLIGAHRNSPPPAGRVAFDILLQEADVVSLHCPLTPETHNLIDATALALMKPDALLINAARGGIVDETALATALRNGRLGGAGIDVLSQEPPVNGNPLLAPDIPNLIVTPHVAWASRESRQRLVDQVTENIQAFLAGTVRNRVN